MISYATRLLIFIFREHTLLLEHFIHLPPLMAKVFIIQSAMPAMTSTGVVAKEYGADYEFGTLITVITTVLSMVAIPIYMLLL